MARRASIVLCVALLLGACSGDDDRAADDGPADEPEAEGLPDEFFAPEEGASAQNPAFSPDGDVVLVTIFHEGYNDGPAGLFIVDDGEAEPLLDPEDNDAVNMPGTSWHEDQIVFSSDLGDTGEIWAIPAEGGEPEVIASMEGRYLQ